MTRSLVILSGLAAAVLWLAGCNNHSTAHPSIAPSSGQQNAPPLPPAEQNRKVDQMDASAGSADALARKTQAYARELETMLNARSALPPVPVPSAVQWLDPSEFNIGSVASRKPQPPVEQTRVQPVIDTPAAQPKAQAAEQAVASAVVPRAMVPRPSLSGGSDVLADKLSRRIKDYPRDVSAHLEYQLLQFLFDQPTPQISALASLPTEDREMLSAVLDGLTNFRNALRADNNMLLSKKIKPILDMAERLRGQADLTIPAMALCTRVNGFGSYDPIEPARFITGRETPLIVYCEVANFASNLNDRQLWETRLNWDLILYTEQGMSVWSDKTQTIIDTSRNRRHDFFMLKKITLPPTLTIGRYLLKATVVDTQSNRIAESTVPLVVAAQ